MGSCQEDDESEQVITTLNLTNSGKIRFDEFKRVTDNRISASIIAADHRQIIIFA